MDQFYHKKAIFPSVDDFPKVTYFRLVNLVKNYFLVKSLVSIFPMILDQNYNLIHQYHLVKYASDQFLYLNLMKYMNMINIKHNFICFTLLLLVFKFTIHDTIINIFRNFHVHYLVQLWEDYLILVSSSLN